MASPTRTRSTPRAEASIPSDPETGSSSQRERRRRILDATLALASKGGYDAVQMRAVADKADVAVGTLYRYFPSKVHLLVSALHREFEKVDDRPQKTSARNGTAEDRLKRVVHAMTRTMQKDPLLTEAMTRAFMFADASAATEVELVGRLIDRIFAKAMTPDEPSQVQLDIARVISDVWLSNQVAWLTRRSSATDVSKRMDLTIHLLLNSKSAEV